MILVESDTGNEMKNMAVRVLLERNGYTFLQHKKNSFWFFNNDWANIYGKLIY